MLGAIKHITGDIFFFQEDTFSGAQIFYSGYLGHFLTQSDEIWHG